ncbi:MAG: WD40 repeat domain-containing protein [Verrucomicrobia bacterium]|nr:WD40 repeat domain-containing protein [Verrucomicrobiota bacterium]
MQLTKHWAATLDDYVIDLAWAPDGGPEGAGTGSVLAAASAAGSISLFARHDGAPLHVLPGHADGTNCLAWGPGNRSLLVSGGQDGCVKFWDASAGQHTATAKLGSAWVEHLAFGAGTTPQAGAASCLIFAAAGRQLTALRPDASVAHTFEAAPKTLCALAPHPRGGALATAYFGGVCLWDTDDFVAQKRYPYGNGIHALIWSPDGKWLVSGNQDPSVHLWVPEQDIELNMSGYEGKVKALSFDHTSRWLATSGGRDACVWDCSGPGPEGREPAMLPHEAPVGAVKFQHAHGLLATGSADGTVQIWSPERRQPLRATVRMPSPATRFAWSPDDAFLAIGTERGNVYVLKCEA